MDAYHLTQPKVALHHLAGLDLDQRFGNRKNVLGFASRVTKYSNSQKGCRVNTVKRVNPLVRATKGVLTVGRVLASQRVFDLMLDASKALGILGGRVSMDKGSYGAFVIYRYSGEQGRVRVGKFCSIGRGVEFITGGNHHKEWVTTFPIQ